MDLEHRDILLDWDIEVLNSSEISGKRISKSWAEEQHFYFHMEFSEEFDTSYNKENPTKLFLSFNDLPNNQIMVKVGVSVVSSQNAKENLLSEANHWDFDKYL